MSETGLTLQKLHAAVAQMKAFSVPLPVRVFPSDFWPREHVGDTVYSYLPHPFWRWVWRTILRREFPLSMERGARIYQDKPMVMDRHTGAVYCSHRQAAEINRALK